MVREPRRTVIEQLMNEILLKLRASPNGKMERIELEKMLLKGHSKGTFQKARVRLEFMGKISIERKGKRDIFVLEPDGAFMADQIKAEELGFSSFSVFGLMSPELGTDWIYESLGLKRGSLQADVMAKVSLPISRGDEFDEIIKELSLAIANFIASNIGYNTPSNGYLQISFNYNLEEERKNSLNELKSLMEMLVRTEDQENIKEIEKRIATILTHPDMTDVLERIIKITKEERLISLFSAYKKSNDDFLLCRVVNLLTQSLKKKCEDIMVRPEHVEGAKALIASVKRVYGKQFFTNRSIMKKMRRELKKPYKRKPKTAKKYDRLIANLAQQRIESLNKLLKKMELATSEDIEHLIRIDRQLLKAHFNGIRELKGLPGLT